MMEELRAILRRGRPGDDYWVAYWRLREELTKQLGCERMAVVAKFTIIIIFDDVGVLLPRPV